MTEGADREAESWAQTLITITPEEDAPIRKILETTPISALAATPFVLGVDDIAERQSSSVNAIRPRSFIDISELEKRTAYIDAECQTCLRGFPAVELPTACTDEGTQTLYLGNVSPSAGRYRNIARIMNAGIMPVAERRTEAVQSVVTFAPDASRDRVVDRLNEARGPEGVGDADDGAWVATAYVTDILRFTVDRVRWLTAGPGDHGAPKVRLTDKGVQTCIKYANGPGKVVLDADTQTSLTCEPRRSNASLLGEYTATKVFARDVVENCLERGVHPRALVDTIVDEVIEGCAARIRLPYRDEMVQTLAPCRPLEDEDEELLRKLRLEVVVDSLESSMIVLPVMGLLLDKVCRETRRKASAAVSDILDRIRDKAVSTAARRTAIREEAASRQCKPMDEIFETRRRRLRELLGGNAATKQSSGTQTGLAGVPDLAKVREPRESVRCACEASPDARWQDVRGAVLRTRDILIAYKPCCTVTLPPLPAPRSSRRSASTARDEPRSPAPCGAKDRGRSTHRMPDAADSLDDWTRVVRGSPSTSDAWSVRGGGSSDDKAAFGGVRRPSATSLVGGTPAGRTRLAPSGSVNALRILKSTFKRNDCTCSYDQPEERGAPSTGVPDRGKLRVVPIIHLQGIERRQAN